MYRATRPYPKTQALERANDVENLILFIDDDLRETALAVAGIEGYLVNTLKMLEQERLNRADVHTLATDTIVLEQLDLLTETLESLRRRMVRLSGKLR